MTKIYKIKQALDSLGVALHLSGSGICVHTTVVNPEKIAIVVTLGGRAGYYRLKLKSNRANILRTDCFGYTSHIAKGSAKMVLEAFAKYISDGKNITDY